MSEGSPATILFVDDDVNNRQLLCLLFRERGYHVLESGAGNEALELARQHRPDLIILDINLPDINGFEVCQRLRQDSELRPGILLLSGEYVGADDRTAGLDGGADAYLTKPVETRELLAVARALLRARAAEEATRRAARQWRATFDAIGDAVCLLDAAGTISRCNRALASLVGLAFPRLIGRPLGVVLREAFGAEAEGLALGKQTPREGRELELAGRWFHVTCDPVALPHDDVDHGRVLVLTDRTKHKELEEQLRQSHRLESVGRLAGGIAHDFNNLLTAVLGNSALLLRSLPAGESDHSLAATIERAAWRAADLTRQLLGFSRQALLWLQTVDPAALLGDVAAAVKPPDGVALDLRRGEGVWPVQADPTQLAQVFAALCRNALDAMPGGGRLTLAAENRSLEPAQAADHPDARPGEFVCLSVEDTGKGIEANLLDKIFDPFFTTKPLGQGRGLSLAMVHGILKQHQGWVRCHSEAGRGTRFELYLPRAQPQASVAAPLVLLADHDDTLRALAAAYLRQAGYDVLTAQDGAEAVELFRREQARFELVILDARLSPGGEALQQIRALRPVVRALLASDSPEDAPAVEGALGVVGRPYRERDLLDAVKKAMG